MSVLDETYRNLCQRLRQFGRLQAGRLLGTVPDTRGSYKAWMDAYEKFAVGRAELNPLTKLMIEKGVFTRGEWLTQVTDELAWLIEQEAKGWPEVEVFADGRGFTVKDLVAFKARCEREAWPP